MIVTLGNRTRAEAQAMLERAARALGGHRHLEAAPPRTFKVPAHHSRLERERMRVKVYGTRELTTAMRVALDGMRRDALQSLGNLGNIDAQTLAATIDRWNFDPRHFTRAMRPTVARMFHSGTHSADQEVGTRPKREAVKTAAPPRKPPASRSATDGGADDAYSVLTSFDVPPHEALDQLYGSTLEFAEDIVDREKVALKDLLMRGLGEGLSGDQVASEIRDFFADGMHYVDEAGQLVRTIPEDSWIDMVARSESARAFNAGTAVTFARAGVEQVVFYSAEDERTCPVCFELDGKVLPIDSPDLPPVHPSCRCTIVAYDEGDTQDEMPSDEDAA